MNAKSIWFLVLLAVRLTFSHLFHALLQSGTSMALLLSQFQSEVQSKDQTYHLKRFVLCLIGSTVVHLVFPVSVKMW